jgi:hypothetical protein
VNRRAGRWREVALFAALAGVLAALAALGIGVLATWDVAGPPAPQGIETGRLQALPAAPTAGE